MSHSATPPLTGRVAVVTGATSGIGRVVAEGLAARGARTVLVGRGEERVRAAAGAIARSTGNPAVTPLAVGDLSLLADTRHVASELMGDFPQIHVLVNNAGAYFRHREVTPEGKERTFALNVLSPFLLTSLLAPRLVAGAPSRVVNVASAAHQGQVVDFDDLQGTKKFAGYRAYGESKLELILLTREFARRLQGTGVLVNAVHPGFVRSGFGLNNGGGTAFAIRVLGRLFGRSLDRGADTPIYVASDPAVARVNGAYIVDRKVESGSLESNDAGAARRLFDICRTLTDAPDLPAPASAAIP